MLHSLVFPGMVVPCQALFCGFVVIPSTMHNWLSWGVDLDPMNWVMNALFHIGVKGNEDALEFYDFHELKKLYGWHTEPMNCFAFLLAICVTLKFLSYLAMVFVNFQKA